MSAKDRHVVPNPKGGWDVVKPHADRASSHHDTQADAVDRAREITRAGGGGIWRPPSRRGWIGDEPSAAPAKVRAPPAG